MTYDGFLTLFLLNCALFCEVLFCFGQVYPPSNQSSFDVIPGSTVRLKWTFDGNPSLAGLVWSFTRRGDSKEEEIAVKYRTFPATTPSSSLPGVAIENPSTLVLKNVDKRYNGKYKFKVQLTGAGGEAEVELFIVEKPNATVNCSSSVTLNEGDDVTCVCRGEGGVPAAKVSWFKNGEQFGETVTLQNTLTLSNVNGTATGTYKCEARSNISDSFKDEKSIELKVRLNYKPIIKSFTSDPVQPLNGYPVILRCESDGVPEPGYMIKFENGSVSSAKTTYYIPAIGSSYDGNYTCIAKNIKGNDSATLNLNVQDETSSNGTNSRNNWPLVVVILVSGIIIALFLAFIIWCLRRRVVRNRNPERGPEPQASNVDPTYQELDLSKMNIEDNYQSLRVNAATNEDDSTYTTLSKTRDEENTYQTLT